MFVKTILLQTYDEEFMRDVCNALNKRNIKYSTKFKDYSKQSSINDAMSIKLPTKISTKIQYSIYVNKKDLKEAQNLVFNIKKDQE